MKKIILTCFSPLREKQSSTNFSEAIELISSLIDKINNLKLLLAKTSTSLQWCSHATNLVKKMHAEFLRMFEKHEVLILMDSVDYLDEYMKVSLNLLDLCNCLKSAVSRMNRYCLQVNVALKRFSIEGCFDRVEVGKLENEYAKLFTFSDENWKDLNHRDWRRTFRLKTRGEYGSFCALLVLRNSMNIICKLLFSVMIRHIPLQVNKEMKASKEDPRFRSFLFSLDDLVCCFDKEVKANSRGVLVERKLIEKSITGIKEQVFSRADVNKETFSTNLNSMETTCRTFKDGLQVFDSAVTELFDEVVSGRNKILAAIGNLQ